MATSTQRVSESAQDLLKNRKAIAIAIVMGLLAIVVIIQLVTSGPRKVAFDSPGQTLDRLRRLTAECNVFVTNQQRLPGSLEEFTSKLDPSYKKDGWGHEFVYAAGTDGAKKTSYSIRSGGPDGTAGNEDDFVSTAVFGDDGYGKLGVLSGSFVPDSAGP